ncbi:hypothetical protein KB559_21390 [Paenibacillus sp. Marseille-P2973]|uniref:ATP-binding protein n=1 Tax=Paenibacillus sp. Marseille-P2973 TaxID=1871032 RepID=UPI001B399434|nr:ATP-binding protein [Paenibacillus sp. Marseille-P2973]MBQ4901403.1 hypothetical protein [Paenibacillus sp. Marseille-P2973]
MRSRLNHSRWNRLFIYSCLVFFIGTASYIQYRSLTTPYTGISFKQSAPSEWVISGVQTNSLASSSGLVPGDRILSFDEKPGPRLFSIGGNDLLIHTKKIEILDKTGHQRTIEFNPTRTDYMENGFAFLVEVFLLGVGLYAVRKRPESRLFRRFFLMNLMMAFSIVYLFSDEIPLSNYLFPFVAVWLLYVMLSFYLLFGFRATFSKFRTLLLIYRVYAILFSLFVAFIFIRKTWFPIWVTDLLNFSLIFTLVLMVGITAFHWTGFDRIEKNQLFILLIGASLSLMPYILLFALPYLLWKFSFVPEEYTLVGLVPLSGTFTYLLVRRQMLDLKGFLSKLALRTLYCCFTLSLLVLAAVWGNPAYAVGLWILFTVATWGYRQLFPYIRRQGDHTRNWLKNQKLSLSLQLHETNHIRDMLKLIADLVHDRIELQGLVIVYQGNEGYPLIYGSGIYKDKWTFGVADQPDNDDWIRKANFHRVMELSENPGSRRFGYLCLGPKADQTPFSSSEQDIIEKIRGQATELLANIQQIIQLQHEYKRKKDEVGRGDRRDLRTYDQAAIEAREAEKIRISYFLHDDLLQNLIFLSRDLEELIDTGRYEAERAATWLKCLYDSQRSIRSLSDLLYPHILDKGDLQEALRWLLRDLNREEEIVVSLHYEAPSPEPFPAYIKANLFRAVRELIVNVFKHAQATEMQVRLWMSREHVFCSVTDNGIGFLDPTSLERSKSGDARFGLLSVCDQVEQLGGITGINSVPGQGTSITLKLPLFKET